MDRRYRPDSSLNRSVNDVESGTFWSASSRWKPTDTQKRILKSLFASGIRNTDREHINRITAVLQPHGPVDAKNVFYWFQNAAARNKQKKEKAESSSLYPSRRSSDESSVQEEEVDSAAHRISLEQDVESVACRSSSVDPPEIRTLDLFPLHPGM